MSNIPWWAHRQLTGCSHCYVSGRRAVSAMRDVEVYDSNAQDPSGALNPVNLFSTRPPDKPALKFRACILCGWRQTQPARVEPFTIEELEKLKDLEKLTHSFRSMTEAMGKLGSAFKRTAESLANAKFRWPTGV